MHVYYSSTQNLPKHRDSVEIDSAARSTSGQTTRVLLETFARPSRTLYDDSGLETSFNRSWYERTRSNLLSLSPSGTRRLLAKSLVSVSPRIFRLGTPTKSKPLSPTAYLDGLRGWAALLVFRFHVFRYESWLFNQYFFAGLMSGFAMTSIFFVISGYVLSLRLLKLMRTGRQDLLMAVASSIFRRWFRLFIPLGFATFITAILCYYGFVPAKGHVRQNSFFAQIGHWFWDTLRVANPFARVFGWSNENGLVSAYLDPMWTIPAEYRGSIAVFTLCVLGAFMAPWTRRVSLGVFIVSCYAWAMDYVALFTAGMVIADLSLDRHPERLAPRSSNAEKAMNLPKHEVVHKTETLRRKMTCCMGVGVALYLFGRVPDPLYAKLEAIAPLWYEEGQRCYFYPSVGALILVAAIDNCRMLQIPLEWPLAQYLGDISFGIYAMHDIIAMSWYQPILEPWAQDYLGDRPGARIPGMILVTIMVLCSAEWFTMFDDQAVAFTKWLESKFLTE
jgi:peptidoglycan/LPS O-acetylase OafA/YrhL